MAQHICDTGIPQKCFRSQTYSLANHNIWESRECVGGWCMTICSLQQRVYGLVTDIFYCRLANKWIVR